MNLGDIPILGLIQVLGEARVVPPVRVMRFLPSLTNQGWACEGFFLFRWLGVASG